MPALLPETVDTLNKLINPTHGFNTEAPSLLNQLKEAIFGGMESSGGSSFGSKMPLDAAALDLYNLIESESAALYVGAARYQSRSGREEGLWGQFGAWDKCLDQLLPTSLTESALIAFSVKKWRYAFSSPRENIEAWVATVQTEFQSQVAARIIDRWVNAINRLLYPESKREFLAPCLTCKARWFHEHETGARSAAVILTAPDGMMRADCRACSAKWVGGREVAQMMFDAELQEKITHVVDNDSQNA